MEKLALVGLANLIVWLIVAPFKILAWIFSPGEPTRSINPDGYIIQNKSKQLEHRQIAIKLLGRNLLPGEVVHHINGKKTDNTVTNLCLMDAQKHEHFHAWLNWKKEKSGRYPSIKSQKRTLVAEYSGTLLESVKPKKQVTKAVKASNLKDELDLNPNNQKDTLLNALKGERKKIAKLNGVPAYLIFHDTTLIEMEKKRPTTEYSMLNIRGVGPEKMERYGQAFINIILSYQANSGDESA